MSRTPREELNDKQLAYVAHLLAGCNQKEAAAQPDVQVHEVTASTWMKLPQIRDALRQGESSEDVVNRTRVRRAIQRRLEDQSKADKISMRDLEIAYKIFGGFRPPVEHKPMQAVGLIVRTSADREPEPVAQDATPAISPPEPEEVEKHG